MVDRDLESVDGRQNTPAQVFEAPREVPDLSRCGRKQHIKSPAKRGIVGGERRQNPRMIDRFAKRSLQVPYAGYDARVHKRVEILKSICLVKQRTEFSQQLHMLFGKRGNVGLGKDFEQ